MARDLLGILEAAYREGSEAQWRQGLLDAAKPLDHGLGVLFVRAVSKPNRYALGYDEFFGTSHPDCWPFFLDTARELTEDQVRRILRSSGGTASMLLGADAVRTMTQAASADLGIRDCIGIHALVSQWSTFGVHIVLPRVIELDRRTVRRHRLLGAHLAAARRLREGALNADAVLEPSGRVAHAEPAAEAARDVLVRSVRAIELARSQRGRSDVDGALALWRGLVAGEWSLAERFEADGRRFLVARRNAPHLGAMLRLSPTEARVVRLTALGHSQKMVGYVLGSSLTVVSEALRNGMLKLRVRHRSELAAVAGPLVHAAEKAQGEPGEA